MTCWLSTGAVCVHLQDWLACCTPRSSQWIRGWTSLVQKNLSFYCGELQTWWEESLPDLWITVLLYWIIIYRVLAADNLCYITQCNITHPDMHTMSKYKQKKSSLNCWSYDNFNNGSVSRTSSVSSKNYNKQKVTVNYYSRMLRAILHSVDAFEDLNSPSTNQRLTTAHLKQPTGPLLPVQHAGKCCRSQRHTASV